MRTYGFTEALKEEWERQGRGTGERDDWNPWLHRGDFRSDGIASIDSLIGDNGREIHTLSNLEHDAWKVYSTSSETCFIQEQFPHDRDLSRQICRSELGIEHPRDPGTQVDIVVTTDLVITVRRIGGPRIRIARSVKLEEDLTSHNQAEHAELEKRLCARIGITDFKFLAQRSFPPQLLRNVDLLYMHRDLHKQEAPLAYADSFEYVSSVVVHEIRRANTDATLADFCFGFNQSMKWPPGLAMRAALHAIRWHKLKADLLGSPLQMQSVRTIAGASRSSNVRKLSRGG